MQVSHQILDAVVAHARFAMPEEACGLLAADEHGCLRMAYCLTNVSASRTAFTVDPDEHFHAMLHAERQGWTLAGAFHSHPVGEAIPSRTDVAAALYPGWWHLVVGRPGSEEPEIRAWTLEDGVALEHPIEVADLACR